MAKQRSLVLITVAIRIGFLVEIILVLIYIVTVGLVLLRHGRSRLSP